MILALSGLVLALQSPENAGELLDKVCKMPRADLENQLLDVDNFRGDLFSGKVWDYDLEYKRKVGAGTPLERLIRMGAKAIPTLLKQLDNQSSSNAVFKSGGMTSFHLTEYYDPKILVLPSLASERRDEPKKGDSLWEFTVRKGEIAFFVLGQIVNRHHGRIEYFYSLNSPIESPKIKERAIEEWSGLTSMGLKKLLINDILFPDTIQRQAEAFCRLRNFYPAEAKALALDLLSRKRVSFSFWLVPQFQPIATPEIDDLSYRLLKSDLSYLKGESTGIRLEILNNLRLNSKYRAKAIDFAVAQVQSNAGDDSAYDDFVKTFAPERLK